MKHRKPKFVINPFSSTSQREACYAKKDPNWDCAEWSKATGKKKLPRRKRKAVANARRRNPLKLDPSRTATLRRAFVAQLRKVFAGLKSRVRRLVVDEDAFGLESTAQDHYGLHPSLTANRQSLGLVEDHRTLHWEERQGQGIHQLVEVPDVRQPDHYSCGASASMSVGLYYGVGPKTIDAWKEALGTDVEESTHPQAIIDYFTELGCAVEAGSGWGLGDLTRFAAAGVPVIVPVQDYGPRVPEAARFAYGHYMVVIGVALGYVFLQDPSEDNVVAGGDQKALSETGSVQKPGRIIVDAVTFLKIWHDVDADGNRYVRFGIAVGRPGSTPPAGESAGPTLDLLGGVVPADLDRAKEVDYVTLAPDVWGTNCGNCRFVKDYHFFLFCQHPKVRFAVGVRNCCAKWDSVGTKRAFKGDPTVNQRWQFATDPEKLKAFQAWLKAQFGKDLTSPDAAALWQKYAEQGFKKGAGRAFDDTRKAQAGLAQTVETKSFYEGGRDEFLRSSFAQPVAVEKIQLLAARSFNELDGVTDAMEQRMTRTLADGLVQGKSPLDIARDLDDDLDLGRYRCEVIARTEIVRSHAEGQLQALEDMGIDQVGAQVEWSTAGDESVCMQCSELEGQVFDIDDARGMLPLHPLCRCAWVPFLADTRNARGQFARNHSATTRPLSKNADTLWDQLIGNSPDFDEHLYKLYGRDALPPHLRELEDLLANQSGSVSGQEEGAAETRRVVRRRARKGKDISVLPPADDEDVIKDIPSGHGSLDTREKKARDDQDVPPRNARS